MEDEVEMIGYVSMLNNSIFVKALRMIVDGEQKYVLLRSRTKTLARTLGEPSGAMLISHDKVECDTLEDALSGIYNITKLPEEAWKKTGFTGGYDVPVKKFLDAYRMFEWQMTQEGVRC